MLVDGRPTGLLSLTDVSRVLEVLSASRAAVAVTGGQRACATKGTGPGIGFALRPAGR